MVQVGIVRFSCELQSVTATVSCLNCWLLATQVCHRFILRIKYTGSEMVLATQRPALLQVSKYSDEKCGGETEEKAEQSRVSRSRRKKRLPIKCCDCVDPTGNGSLTISRFAWLLRKC